MAINLRNTLVTILAGGESRRMGQDKALLLWQGHTLLEHMAHKALQATQHVVVAGRARPDNWPFPSVPFLPDAAIGEGLLRGLEAALTFADGCPVLALACDMPLISVKGLRWLMTRDVLEPHGLAVVHQGQLEPLFSVYTAACLPLLRQHLAEGRRSLHSLIAAGSFALALAPPEIGSQMVNVNTPEQLLSLRQAFGKHKQFRS